MDTFHVVDITGSKVTFRLLYIRALPYTTQWDNIFAMI